MSTEVRAKDTWLSMVPTPNVIICFSFFTYMMKYTTEEQTNNATSGRSTAQHKGMKY